jgi:hypothetical protein
MHEMDIRCRTIELLLKRWSDVIINFLHSLQRVVGSVDYTRYYLTQLSDESVMELIIANTSVYHQKSGFLSNIPLNFEVWIAKVFQENILLPFLFGSISDLIWF